MCLIILMKKGLNCTLLACPRKHKQYKDECWREEGESLQKLKKKEKEKESRGFTWTHFLPCLPLAAGSILPCIHMVIGVRR